MADRKRCFVIGPIGEDGSEVRQKADWLLRGIFKPVLEAAECGYEVKRADEDADPGSITSALINDIITADLVVADLTDFNANVFYELGIRHAIQKPAIHFTAQAVPLPFDNKDQRTIFVDLANFDSIEIAKERLRKAAARIVSDGFTVSNPVTQAKAVLKLLDSSDPKDQLIAQMEERLDRLERGTVAEGIRGQGPLATMSVANAARALRNIAAQEAGGNIVDFSRVSPTIIDPRIKPSNIIGWPLIEVSDPTRPVAFPLMSQVPPSSTGGTKISRRKRTQKKPDDQ